MPSSPNKDTKEFPVSSLPDEAQQKIRALEAELAQTKAQKAKSKSPLPAELGTSERLFLMLYVSVTSLPTEPPAVSRAPKGNSLANPHKKARKYQALEFGSDDE